MHHDIKKKKRKKNYAYTHVKRKEMSVMILMENIRDRTSILGEDRRSQLKSTPRHTTKNSRRKLAVWMFITAIGCMAQ